MVEQNGTLTLETFAVLARVSRPVAWAIMSGRPSGNPRFSETTRARVLALAEEYRFRPNRTASNLRRGRHGAVGLVMHSFWPVSPLFVEGLSQAASRAGFSLMIEALPDWQMPVEDGVFTRNNEVDGIIAFGAPGRGTVRKPAGVSRLRVPVLWLDAWEETGWIVRNDEAQAMRLCVQRLAAAGCSRLALFQSLFLPHHYYQEVRAEAFTQAGAAHRAQTEVFPIAWPRDIGESERDTMCDQITAFLKKHPKLDGAVLSNDLLAPLFYEACHRLRKKVPGSMSVIGVNDSPTAVMAFPALTSLQTDEARKGTRAFELWHERLTLANDAPVRKIEEMPFRMIERSSVTDKN